MISRVAYPRAAVIGNPSDGFYGKTIAFPFNEFHAEASLSPENDSKIRLNQSSEWEDLETFYEAFKKRSLADRDIIGATLKKLVDYCRAEDVPMHDKGLELAFESSIPREVGLAGSSAIITALLRTLLVHYKVSIPLEQQANLILQVETEEMGISAGLQDRVVQAFERPVHMDFDKELMATQGYGNYSELNASVFRNLFIAYRPESAESSNVVHNNLGERYRDGDPKVHAVMQELAAITDTFYRELLHDNRLERLGALMDRNFDLRKSICAISENNLGMIEIARAQGASAKFTGSGGAIIGVFESDEMYDKLEEKFVENNIQVFKPTIVSDNR